MAILVERWVMLFLIRVKSVKSVAIKSYIRLIDVVVSRESFA